MFQIASSVYVFNAKKTKTSVKFRALMLGIPVSCYNPKQFWRYNKRMQDTAVIYSAMLGLDVTQYF